jgi:hypothetical protein
MTTPKQAPAETAMEGEHIDIEATKSERSDKEPGSMYSDVAAMMKNCADATDPETSKAAFKTFNKLAKEQRKIHEEAQKTFRGQDELLKEFYTKAFLSAEDKTERAQVRAEYNAQLNASRDAAEKTTTDASNILLTTLRVTATLGGVAALGLVGYAVASSRK